MTTRLVFLGSGAFGLPTLERLIEVHEVPLVVSQPDRPAGRRRTLSPTPVAAFAADHGIPVIKPERVNEREVIERIAAAGGRALVVIAYGHKLGPGLLEGFFAINLHGSLLPKYRGAAPINRAMMEGETETGVSVIALAQRMDAGAIYAARATAIDPGETAGELHDRLAALGPEAVLETLDGFERGVSAPIEQDEARATRAPKLSKGEGTVDFDRTAGSVRCRVHGLTPWPGCAVRIEEHRLKLLRVEAVAADSPQAEAPGTIQGDLSVACASGAVRLLSVQPPGGRPMTMEAYCNGHEVEVGARMDSL